MEVRVLGPVEVVGDDGAVVAVPGRKLQLLVAVLGFHGAAVGAWTHLARAWAERGPDGAADARRCADEAVAAAERGDQPGFLARARAFRDSLAPAV